MVKRIEHAETRLSALKEEESKIKQQLELATSELETSKKQSFELTQRLQELDRIENDEANKVRGYPFIVHLIFLAHDS